MSLIVLSIPVFFILIGVELLIVKLENVSYYRFNDAVTNLSCGIGSQVSGIFLKTLTVLAYIKLYEISPLNGKISNTWWVWVLLFLAADFCYYWFHRLAHEISLLWGSHVVHHQSEEYNLTVALRQAWYQGAFSFVFYLPLALIGFEPKMFFVVSQIITLYQFWIHTKLINKMHPAVEYIFNTPSHHRVHHGVNPKYIDKNHAGTLIIWDRMFGTFHPEDEEVVFGITKQPNSWNPIWVNFEYWIDLMKNIFKVHQIKNAILMLIKMPGWKPKELGGIDEPKPVTPATFHKYNTILPKGLNHYIFFQFVIILLGTTMFLLFESKPPFSENIFLKATVASLIIFSLFNIGGIFERKGWVVLLEYIRILLFTGIMIYLLHNSAQFIFVGVAISVVALLSLIWFSKFANQFKPKNF